MKLEVAALWLVMLLQDPIIEKAKKTLEKTPDDPAANLTMGIYHAERAKWDLALACFEKAKSPEIRAAVDAEKKLDGNQFTAVEVGDAWAKAMGKAGSARQACFDRMNIHYAVAWEKLDAFGKAKLKERLTRLYTPATPVKSGELPKSWGGPVDLRSKAVVSSARVRSGSGALKMTPTYAGTASIVRVEVTVPNGKVIEFSGWIASEGTDTTQDGISYKVLDKVRKPIGGKNFIFPPDSFIWTRIGDEIAFPDGAFSVLIEVILGSNKGFAWIDDLSVRVDGKEVLKGGGLEPQ